MLGSVWAAGGLLVVASLAPLRAADGRVELERRFSATVRPLVTKYCIGCHSGNTPAAQFDLRAYTTLDSVIHDFPHWNLLLERVKAQEMPPKAAPQPDAEARKAIVEWVQAVRTEEARRNDGDPGTVLARRLSNAEYNNTIRDLTGVDMRPTKEFPVDPANTAGFDNSGESLAMSPALLNKYLQAARSVGDHMVLTPDGIDFAPYPMLVETDRDRYAIQRIVNFYKRQPTDYADYFRAAWRFQQGLEPSLERAAASAKISPKYLAVVWPLLQEKQDAVGPIAKLQELWRAQKFEEARDFVVRIRKDTAMEFAAPRVPGLSPTSQPLMNWKFRQFNSHRRDFDPAALRMESDPPPVAPTIPRYPGLGQESAVRAAALMLKSRAGDPDLLVPDGQRERYEAAFAKLSAVFPDVFYVSERGRFFPDDSEDKGRLLSAGYHNVMGYWRDDQPLQELILDERGKKQLDRLWDEFDFIADHTERTWVQYFFNQSGEVEGHGRESGSVRPSDKEVSATPVIMGLRDAYLAKAAPANNPVAMEAIRYHFQWVNDTIRRMEKMRLDAEPYHLEALERFAARAYRRPLTPAERDEMLSFYHSLREKDGLTHEDAIRDSIVRVLMSPKFCYRIDLLDVSKAKTGAAAAPLSTYALASRLSYFLWASMPDEELLSHAKSGDLRKPEVIAAQARRMLKDERSSGLALEFGGNWLDFRRFEEHNAVDRERFPSFDNNLREAMFQEPLRFLEDMVQNDRSILDAIYGKYTFVNPVLAKHYGIPDVTGDADHWVRIDDASEYGRGGLLPMSVFLTANSPGLRTSPVKRGNWVVKRVLGEQIPPPPAVVPELPSDEAKSDLPIRQMLAKHRQVQMCAQCHSKFDDYGLAFEGYGPIGERREVDLAGRPVDTRATFPGGSEGLGYEAIVEYIRGHRQNDYIDNFSRKLLAYALGRSLQLSDEPEVERMERRAAAEGYRFAPLVEAIVTSRQFLNKRRLQVQTR